VNASSSGPSLKGQTQVQTGLNDGGNVSSTHLEGANLSNSKIDGAMFDGAVYDVKTILPQGLNPDAHKMVFVQSVRE
jgi:uncharacterized protein YjbI with pentapeptide repeats